jgi:phosphate-selective porin OprO/OprP
MKKTSVFSASSVALAVAALCASVPAFAQVEAKVTGRVHFDARDINTGMAASNLAASLSAADNYEIRRARIGIVGTINKDIAYEVVGNAVGSNTNFLDTAWVNYGFNKAAQIRTGRFKQPFSLEELTSSNSIDFMERSYGNQIVPGKRIGMMVHGEPMKGLVYGVSAFQNDFAETASNGFAGNNYAARLAVDAAQLIANNDNIVLHAGLANTQGRADVAGSASTTTMLKLRSESRGLADTLKVVLGGTLAANSNKNNKNVNGLELALATGPFKFQAENFDSTFDMSNYDVTRTANIKLKANYYEFMYNVTGESWAKSYKGGAFSSISPAQVFMKDYGGVVGNGIGAWQVGVRMSSYDATGSTVTGVNSAITSNAGSALTSTDPIKADTTTYALNWILNSNARVMLNYADTKFGTDYKFSSTLVTQREKVVSLRTQVNF